MNAIGTRGILGRASGTHVILSAAKDLVGVAFVEMLRFAQHDEFRRVPESHYPHPSSPTKLKPPTMPSLLPRVLEPEEAMDTLDEAVDYDSMDHAEVNRAFVADLLAIGPNVEAMLDLGTGTAQIPIELCRRCQAAHVLAVDMAGHMLSLGRQNVREAGFAGRIELARADAKRLPYAANRFPTVFSNSLIHHVPDPAVVVREIWRVLASGGLVFLRDLFRPPDEATLSHLVDTYAAGANAHQRRMFGDSLRAALTVEEMGRLVADLGVDPATVQATSDRHWTWAAKK